MSTIKRLDYFVYLTELTLMIDGKNFFDPLVENNIRTYDNIQKNAKVKEMITQLVVSWIIIISINTIK